MLTVAVSVSAGVFAITLQAAIWGYSGLAPYRVEIALSCIAIITIINLRGRKESGLIFSVPTYGFVVSMIALVGLGLTRIVISNAVPIPVAPSELPIPTATMLGTVARQLSREQTRCVVPVQRNMAIVLVSGVDRGIISALEFAKSLAVENTTSLRAVDWNILEYIGSRAIAWERAMQRSETRWDTIQRIEQWIIIGVLLYVLLAYRIAPALWRHYEHNPALADEPKTTSTPEHIPGDPINLGLAGTQAEIIHAFLAAGWSPADPITWRTSVAIARSVLFRRADPTAPVSTLLLYGRRQDLAFERTVGASARQRHHLRLWQTPHVGADGRTVWLGAATFDRSVGISHRTGQITHHIAPDIDAERDGVIGDLALCGQLIQTYQVTGIGPTVAGRNGGGDWYSTDGEITMGVVVRDNAPHQAAVEQLPSPPAIRLKNRVWAWVRCILPTDTMQQQRNAM